jgi:hypothetical protein
MNTRSASTLIAPAAACQDCDIDIFDKLSTTTMTPNSICLRNPTRRSRTVDMTAKAGRARSPAAAAANRFNLNDG